MGPVHIDNRVNSSVTGYAPRESSELVKAIERLEKQADKSTSELDQIRATLLINFGPQGRKCDGITVENVERSTLLIMVDVIRAYSMKLKGL